MSKPVKPFLPIPKSIDTPEFARPPGLPAVCTDADLVEAVKLSVVGAEDEEIAALLHVPAHAVKWWIASREWTAIKDHVLPEMRGLFHVQLCGIRSQLLQQLSERVRLGDPMYNNLGEPATDLDGNQLYRPIKAKELSGILTQVGDVLHKFEIEIGVTADDQGKIDLDELARGLANYAKMGPQLPGKDISGNSERLN